jgi:hypothetical protein
MVIYYFEEFIRGFVGGLVWRVGSFYLLLGFLLMVDLVIWDWGCWVGSGYFIKLLFCVPITLSSSMPISQVIVLESKTPALP